jgi:hypothetical protein
MTTVTTALSQEGIEAEAAASGFDWKNVTGLTIRTFEDGTSFITVHGVPPAHENAGRRQRR